MNVNQEKGENPGPPNGMLDEPVSKQNLKNDDEADGIEHEPFIEKDNGTDDDHPPHKLTTRERRVRMVNTVALFCGYALFGFCVTLLGPALIDLKEVLQTTTKDIVLTFTFQSGGFIVGSFGVGLLIGRLNYNLILMITGCAIIVFVSIMPWMPNLELFILMASLQGIVSSALHTTAQVYLLVLWEHSSFRHSLMQAMHGIWSIAATVGPFILEPFLSRGHQQLSQNSTDNENEIMTSIHGSSDIYVNHSYVVLPVTSEPRNVTTHFETRVQYGFLTVACICIVAPIMATVAFFYERRGICLKKKVSDKSSAVQVKPKRTFWWRIMFVLVIACYFSLYVSIEVVTGTLVATLVVDGLKWSNWTGPIITSVYWGSFGFSRLIAIFIAKHVQAKYMVAVLVSVISLSFLVLSFAIDSHDAVTWVCIAVVGAAEGPFFASGMVIVNKIITLDGIVSAAITIASSAAIMVAMAVVGFLFEEYGHMSMIYYLFATSLLLIVNFSVVALIDSKCTSKHLNSEKS